MPLPGVTVTRADRGPATPPPDDVGSLFAIGLTERGPAGVAVEALSYNQFEDAFGGAAAFSTLSRPVEAYFREGGTRVVVSRIVGPGATAASRDLLDDRGAAVLAVAANGPGAWGNALAVTVTAGTGDARTITLHEGATERFSGTFSDAESAQDALAATGTVTVALGAGEWPVVAGRSTLAGGDDRRASLTDLQWTQALAAFGRDLGPGTVAAPGATTAAVHAALFTHAKDFNRFALADAVDTPTLGTLVSSAQQLRDTPAAGYGQLLAPWERIEVAGVTVTIPPSASQAGRLALADRIHGAGPGQPAAGAYGLSRWSVGVTQTWSESERETLNDAGVTVIRGDGGQVRAYGALTLADPQTFPQFSESSGMRVVMAIHNQAAAELERFVLATIDGRGELISAAKSRLVSILQGWYLRGALFGASPSDAYVVDLGPSVNPPEELAQRRLSAQLTLRTSPFAERIVLTITKAASGDAIQES